MTAKASSAVAAIRAQARAQAAKSSLRSVAAEIPMSLTALRHFLAGGTPQPGTLTKLVRWHEETKQGANKIAAKDVEAAIALLRLYIARGVSPKEIAKRRAEVIDAL